MWIFTQDGFISAVDNGVVPGKLAVRARDRKSLVAIAQITESEIAFSPTRDYQYRVYATKDQLQELLALDVEMIDYDNFKDRVHETLPPEFYRAAGEVWVAMNEVSDKEYRDWANKRNKQDKQ